MYFRRESLSAKHVYAPTLLFNAYLPVTDPVLTEPEAVRQ